MHVAGQGNVPAISSCKLCTKTNRIYSGIYNLSQMDKKDTRGRFDWRKKEWNQRKS
ncbi:MAG: hypothetical protein U9O96_01860 [Candidatus Thermoplasmatota archaeon]|nr:hypothetical protein [Candidatus Thermoplasmatota archaeon]